jgi:hypothetical protein
MAAVNSGKIVYASIYGTTFMPLTYIADDNTFVEFNSINSGTSDNESSAAKINGLRVNSDNNFIIKTTDLLPKEVSSIILCSSTPGSTKKFKLTIDDDGIITTTEVIE